MATLAFRMLLALAAVLASYWLLAYRPPSTTTLAAHFVLMTSRVLVFLLLTETLVLPILLTPEAGVGRRLLAFTVGILLGHAILRWDAVSLVALAMSFLALGGDILARTLIALGRPGIAINGPEVTVKLNGRRPGASFEWTGLPGYPKEFRTTGRWNRWGFNDREPPVGDTDPVVVVVGDSYVEALQIPQSDVFFRVAEARLRDDYGPVRMVGLGESGSGACLAADRLERFGEVHRPTVVVYAFTYNDVRDDYRPWSADALDIELKLPALLSSQFVTFVPSLDLLRFYGRQRARAWLAANRSQQRVNPDSLMLAEDGVNDVASAWETTLKCVDRMAVWARANGSAFAALELPPGSPRYFDGLCRELGSRGLGCDPERPRRRLADHARDRLYSFLTPIQNFRKAWAAGERLRFTWDGHFNSTGHLVVGEFLSAHLPPLLATGRQSDPRDPPGR